MILLLPVAIPTPNAAQAPVKQEQTPVRALTAGPALRVHLCTRLCGRPVARPGESCYPVCTSPVHDAEQILRDAASTRTESRRTWQAWT